MRWGHCGPCFVLVEQVGQSLYDFGVLCIDRGHVAGGILAGKGVCMGVPLVKRCSVGAKQVLIRPVI